MCTVLLPPGVNQIAVNKYIIPYIISLLARFEAHPHSCPVGARGCYGREADCRLVSFKNLWIHTSAWWLVVMLSVAIDIVSVNDCGVLLEWYRVRQLCWEGKRSQCQFVCHECHMHWTGIEPGRPRWETGDWPLGVMLWIYRSGLFNGTRLSAEDVCTRWVGGVIGVTCGSQEEANSPPPLSDFFCYLGIRFWLLSWGEKGKRLKFTL